MKILFNTPIDRDLTHVKERFNKDLFNFLSPPWVKVELKRFDGCRSGDEVHLLINQSGIKQEWVSLITSHVDGENEWSFVDEGKTLPWPLTYWRHHHRVVKTAQGECTIVDDIHYECRFKALSVAIYPMIYAVFAVRPSRYKKYFAG